MWEHQFSHTVKCLKRLQRQTQQDRQCTYNVTFCGYGYNVDTSSAILTAWCHFTQRKHFYILCPKQQWMRSVHIKYLTIFPECNQIWISVVFIKVSNIKFHRNPSSGSCVDMCKQTDGRTGRQRQGHTKLIDAFCGYVIAPKNCW
jgi:hypothetical protein